MRIGAPDTNHLVMANSMLFSSLRHRNTLKFPSFLARCLWPSKRFSCVHVNEHKTYREYNHQPHVARKWFVKIEETVFFLRNKQDQCHLEVHEWFTEINVIFTIGRDCEGTNCHIHFLQRIRVLLGKFSYGIL